jgi:Flp pilus assembly protein TadD
VDGFKFGVSGTIIVMNRKNIIAVSIIVFVFAVAFVVYYLKLEGYLQYNKKSIDVGTVENYFNNADIEGAIVGAENLVLNDPDNIEALLALAIAYAEKGSVFFEENLYGEKAIQTAKQVLLKDPNNSEAYRVIGYANEIMGKYDEARINYDKAISLDPKNSQAYSNKGHSYDLQGDLKNAELWYDKALAVNPKDEHALLNKARVLLRNLSFDESKSVLGNLFSSSNNKRMLAEGYQILAFIELNKKDRDTDASYDAIEKSLSYDSSMPQAWVFLGFLDLITLFDNETEGDMIASIQDIKSFANKALAINKNHAAAYYLLSQMALVEGDSVSEDRYRKLAIEAVPLDITLGKLEKEALLEELQAEFSKI